MSKILSFEQEWTRQMEGRAQIIRFIREAIGVDEVQWSDLTDYNLTLVKNHICKKVTANSAHTYFADIKRFLSRFKYEGILPCVRPEAILWIKMQPQQNVALTDDELRRIENYYDELWAKKGHQAEKDCLTLFLIEAYSGARTSDVEEISENDINNGKLSYVSNKSHILASIPVHRRLNLLLSRKPTKVYHCSTKCRVIKRAAERVGINQIIPIFYRGAMRYWPKWKYLASHTARRAFASILDDNGVPTAEISQYMGHSNLAMTQRYIKSDSQHVSPEAMAFFNG